MTLLSVWARAAAFGQFGEDQSVEHRCVVFKAPSQMRTAPVTQGDAPGVAREPRVFKMGFATAEAAGGVRKTADLKALAMGVGENVAVVPALVNASMVRGNRLGAMAAA